MKWEYKVEDFSNHKANFFTGRTDTNALEKTLNNLGVLGWELVTTNPPGVRHSGQQLIMLFKRPKQ